MAVARRFGETVVAGSLNFCDTNRVVSAGVFAENAGRLESFTDL